MTGSPAIRVPDLLAEEHHEDAVRCLQQYYAPLAKPNAGYTGGRWDTFDPSGLRALTCDRFTADDLVACAPLSAPIESRAAYDLLDPCFNGQVADLLSRIPVNLSFVELSSTTERPFTHIRELYRLLNTIPGLGPTRITKLLARKRPALVPIVDRVVLHYVFADGPQQWQPLHHALRSDNGHLWNRLTKLHDAADLHPAVTTLRVFDVLAWLEGSGHARAYMHASVGPAGVQELSDVENSPQA